MGPSEFQSDGAPAGLGEPISAFAAEPRLSAASHLRLQQRIRRRYQTTTAPIQLGSVQLNFTRIADPNRVLDQIVEDLDRQERGGRPVANPPLPYWAELWDSAAAIGTIIARMKFDRPTNVLDLGCGMGLAGLVAAARGARVMFADLEAAALLFARLNSMAFENRVRTRRLDWRTDRLNEKFDLILGADILYERQQWEFLSEFWKSHLATGGCVLLGEPGRQTGGEFLAWVKPRGWALEEDSQAVATRARPIRIFRLRLQ
jgi:predicted nicotinamide N-methyase